VLRVKPWLCSGFEFGGGTVIRWGKCGPLTTPKEEDRNESTTYDGEKEATACCGPVVDPIIGRLLGIGEPAPAARCLESETVPHDPLPGRPGGGPLRQGRASGSQISLFRFFSRTLDDIIGP